MLFLAGFLVSIGCSHASFVAVTARNGIHTAWSKLYVHGSLIEVRTLPSFLTGYQQVPADKVIWLTLFVHVLCFVHRLLSTEQSVWVLSKCWSDEACLSFAWSRGLSARCSSVISTAHLCASGHHFVFDMTKIVVPNYRNLVQFFTPFLCFTASRAW